MSGLIEDKMFRLQVFKHGLTRTALEAKPQRGCFTTREIRALFEWTDPAQGETRQLLKATHGDGVNDRRRRKIDRKIGDLPYGVVFHSRSAFDGPWARTRPP